MNRLKTVVTILYTNHRGETRLRVIRPAALTFKATPHHSEEQWILDAWDDGKGAERSFAVKDIKAWIPGDIDRQGG